jgi:methylated-DNA-[protein]-cysteine S-methyltransferase
MAVEVESKLQNQTVKGTRKTERAFVDTAIGSLRIEATERGLTQVYLDPRAEKETGAKPAPGSVLARAVEQFEEYFAGTRREFDLPFDLDSTSFEGRVREQAATNVPYGTTVTYGELAAMAGSPRAARAVGNVMRSNPLMLVIPCHRVIGANGSLRGYGGLKCGLDTKRWLLEFEGAEL